MPLRRHVRGRLSKEQRLRRVVEDALVGAGLSEAYTWSLVGSDPRSDAIRLPSPMTSDQALLRTTIVPGLLDAARTGVDAGAEHVGLFEIARVYLPSGEQLPHEHWRVAGVAQGGYEVVKGVVETLLRRARARAPSRAQPARRCSIRESRPRPVPGGSASSTRRCSRECGGRSSSTWTTLFAAVPDLTVYEDVLTYPATLQDIAVAVDEDVEVGALVDAAHEAAGDLLREARVFDVYRGEQVGEGRKSVAIHLVFQSPERTLTEEEASAVRDEIVEALGEGFDADLRA